MLTYDCHVEESFPSLQSIHFVLLKGIEFFPVDLQSINDCKVLFKPFFGPCWAHLDDHDCLFFKFCREHQPCQKLHNHGPCSGAKI